MSWTVEELRRWLDAVEPMMDHRDPFAWLELKPTATPAEIQPAFHAVARNRHPDLYRSKLSPAEFDRLVRIYARIAAAYAELRDPARCEAHSRALRSKHPPPQITRAPTPAQIARTATPVSMPRTSTGSTPPPVQLPRTRTQPHTPAPPEPSSPRTVTATQLPRTVTATQLPRTVTATQLPRTRTEPPLATDSPTGDVEPSRAMNAKALPHYRRAEGALRVGDRTTALLHLRMALASDPASTLLRSALAELLAQR